MATRSRLGRGLSGLLSMTDPAPEAGEAPTPVMEPVAPPPEQAAPELPDSAGEAASGDRLTHVPIGQISVNPHQPRQSFDAAALETLADSIRANGVIQPVIVKPLPDGRFELVAGERRLRAAALANLKEIPVVVRNVDGYTQAQWALVENIHREDLNPIDRAEAYQSLLVQLGLTQSELAGRLGEQRSSVANYLRLLELDPALRDNLRDGTLSFGHAKVLAGVASPAEQVRLAELVASQHLSIRNLERLIEHSDPAESPTSEENEAPAPPSALLHLQEVEQQMIQQLGLRVQLRGGKKTGTGKVTIHYRSLEEFDELVRRCGIQLSDS